MALCIWKNISLAFLLMIFFVRINKHDCFNWWPVDSCPTNLSQVEAATLRLNCSNVKEFRNVYHCLPLSNLSLLVEFCYDGLSGLIEKGNCMVLENQHLNNHPCYLFTNGCPSAPYFPKVTFSFPACVDINRQNKCYIADPSCPKIRSADNATSIKAVQENNITAIVIISAALFPCVSMALILVVMLSRRRYLRRKKRDKHNENSFGSDEISPLIKSNTKNEEERTESEENLPLKTEEEFKIEMQACLGTKDFMERYEKYLAEGSVNVCPISQILIVGEHGVGKTTLLFRLQGRSQQEIEAIKSTRGVECHKEKHSFMITQNQLKLNEKGISNWLADPNQIRKIVAEITNGGNTSIEKKAPEIDDQSTTKYDEVEATEPGMSEITLLNNRHRLQAEEMKNA